MHHDLQAAGKIRRDAIITPQIRARLLHPLHIPHDLPLLALIQALANHIHHRLIEPLIELQAIVRCGRGGATVRVEVAAELDDELEGELGAALERGEALEVREEGGEGLDEVGGGEGVVEGVLEAVQVVVDHGHFAVELEVEGLGRVGLDVH